MDHLLARLSAEADRAVEPQARSLALAELGIYLAQLGRTTEALDILKALRLQSKGTQSAAVLIKILVLDGVERYYEHHSVEALDRVHRANALSKSLGLTDLIGESSVWLAHLAFNFDNFEYLRSAIETSLSKFENLKDSLRARICLVIADAIQYLGRRSESSEWYTCARILARRAQDRAVMAAIEYNRLVMGQSRVRVDALLSISRTDSFYRDWLTELKSVQRLHEGYDARALVELLLVSEAQWCEMQGDFAGALTCLRQIESKDAAARCGMSQSLLELEIRWCVTMGALEDGNTIAAVPTLQEVELWPLNEQVVALSLLRDILDRSNINVDLEHLERLSVIALNHCRSSLAATEVALAPAFDQIEKIRRVISDNLSALR